MAGTALAAAIKRWPDKRSRLASGFYKIKDKAGKIVPFHANEDQLQYLDNQHGLDLVLKARQKGFTTIIQLDFLDDCLFVPNISAGVIAHNLNDAKAFFADKIKFAYDTLPPEFRAVVSATQDASDSMKFSNGSSIRVGTSLRSGTLQRLHVSEYGKLCAKYPEKAREVKSGAFNTVQAGQKIVVESTAEGQGGHFYELSQEAQKKAQQGTGLTELDFKFHFSPWWTSKEYVLSGDVVIPEASAKYFLKLESDGIALSQEQKNWYVKKSEQQGDDMKREYPSTPKEAFEASIEGAYFATQMEKVRREGRICKIPILEAPVYTTWDLGMDDAMTITFWQKVGMERRAIDYEEHSGEGWAFYAKLLRDKGYDYSSHKMPHDVEVRLLNQTATTRKQEAEAAGFQNIEVLKRIRIEQEGIDASRNFLANCYFDEERCTRLIQCLDNYRKDWDDKLGVFKSTPRHDWASHGYKSFESAAIAEKDVPATGWGKKLQYPKVGVA